MQPGDEWVYRLRDSAPSERVRIVSVIKTNPVHPRAEVEFLEDGRIENIPSARLRAHWSRVDAFDELMRNRARLNSESVTQTESDATEVVLDILVPYEIASTTYRPLRDALAVHEPENLSDLMGVSIETIKSNVEWFMDDGTLRLSSEGAVQVSAALCRAHPEPVLQYVLEDEEKARLECATGYTGRISKGKGVYSDPDTAWDWYIKETRPLHELLRQWCGYRAVTTQERLEAAEREVHRLDMLLDRAIRELGPGSPEYEITALREEHVRDRITPSDVRPIVERPSEPQEIYISSRRRGRWW